MDNLPNVPYEYLINLALETGYPNIINLCRSHTNFKKICNDNHFWTLLLLQDFFDLVNNNKFINPKDTYITIYQAFDNDYNLSEQIFDLLKLASKADNLELLKVVIDKYPKYFNSSGVKEVLFVDAMMTGAFNVGKYLLANEKLDIRENAVYGFYLNRDKIGADEFFNIMLNDERVDVKHLIKYSIRYNHLDDLKLFLANDDLISYAFNEAIERNKQKIIEYLLINYDINNQLVEDGIIKTVNLNYKNMLDSLLKTNKYDANKLFFQLSSKSLNSNSINVMRYLLANYDITPKTLQNVAMRAVENVELLKLLIQQKNFNPYFSDNYLLKRASKESLEYLVDNLIDNNNYENILNSIVNYIKLDNLRMILRSKLFKTMTKKKYQVLDSLLFTLLNEKNVDESKILVILNKLKYVNDDILLIAAKKNLLAVIDKLLDFQLNNIDQAFEVALINDNVMAAAMISNYDMCNYIIRIKGFKTCEQLNIYIEASFDDVIEQCLIPLLYSYNEEDEINKFSDKYSTYLTADKVSNIIQRIYSRYDDYHYHYEY